MGSKMRYYDLYDLGSGEPVKLSLKTVFPKAFVYKRGDGIYDAPPGHHHAIMALLWSWEHGEDAYNTDPEKIAEIFLREPGTAFLSSVGRAVTVWSPRHLNEYERKCLGRRFEFDYIYT